ncbi:flippase [Oligoflexia bacterium]|nr:flippase [Oligoflexia bacterium]
MKLLEGLKKNTTGGTLLRGAGSAFALNIIGLGLGFGLQILLARLMGVAHYGAYVYVLSWMSILVLFATFGLDYASLRFIPLYHAKADWAALSGLLRKSFIYTFIISTVVGILTALCVWTYVSRQGGLFYVFLLGALLLPIWSLANLRQATLRALKQIAYARFPDMVVRPLVLALLVGLLWWGTQAQITATFGMAAHVIAVFTAFLVSTYFLKKILPTQVSEHEPQEHARLWLTTAAALMFVSGMHIVLNEIDKIMLGLMIDVDAVGVYSIAARISVLMLFGLQSINTIAAPMISELYASKSIDEFQKFVSKVAKWIAVVSLPMLLIIIFFGQFILGLFGEAFQIAYVPLLLLALGQLVNMSVGPVGFLLTMTGNEKVQLRILIVTLIVNIALNLPAIYYFGINGAAFATSFSIALRNIMAWNKSKALLGVDSSIMYLLRKRDI